MSVDIITKNGSGTPADSTLKQGELAVDLTNKKLFSSTNGTDIIEVGGGGGSGNLPTGAITEMLVHDGVDWVPTTDLKLNEATNQLALFGELLLDNTDDAGLTGSIIKCFDLDLGGGPQSVMGFEHVGSTAMAFASTTLDVAPLIVFADGYVSVDPSRQTPTAATHLASKAYVDSKGTATPGTDTNQILRWTGASWDPLAVNLASLDASGGFIGETFVANDFLGAGNLTQNQMLSAGEFGAVQNSGISTSQVVTTNTNQTISGTKTFTTDAHFNTNATVGNPATTSISGVDLYCDNSIYVEHMSSDGGTVVVSNIVGVLTRQSSDISLKQEILDTGYGLDTIMALRPRDFVWKSHGGQDTGFIAQEVLTVVPEAVPENPDGLLGFREGPIVAVLVKAVQELQEQIDAMGS